MRTKFDQQLQALNQELILMGTLCEKAISMSIKALLDGDESLRGEVFSVGSEVSQKGRDIERACMKLLLQQQPVARDLRLISSALKMIYDMDRVGILACDIAEIAEFLHTATLISAFPIKEMTVEAVGMVSNSLHAFVKRDLSLAREVIARDDAVDALFDSIKRALIEAIASRLAHSEQCIDLLMVAKYLEKIGDHAVNLASWVCYAITGQRAEE